jgi:type IV secretory pathway VirJ component
MYDAHGMETIKRENAIDPGMADQHAMHIMDETGDTKVIWDSENKDEVDAARAQFDALTKKGYLAFKVDKKGEKSEAMRRFDPEAEKIILSPPMTPG